jgi:hypothetical protein
LLEKTPARIVCLVIVMLEIIDFFQKEAQECRRQAAKAAGKNNREYWLRLAQRWERLMQPDAATKEADQAGRFDRPIRQSKTLTRRLAKRRAA